MAARASPFHVGSETEKCPSDSGHENFQRTQGDTLMLKPRLAFQGLKPLWTHSPNMIQVCMVHIYF